MNLEEVKYDAFISYRHTDPDSYVAKQLHKQLEAFKLPKSITAQKKDMSRKIRRVFRDEEELPLATNLADPITEALENSKYLIVICSPRLKESMWCKKEIDTFISMHGRENVFAVLAEGEPSESFPEQLLRDSEGNLVEPLAADLRGKNKAQINRNMKTEILRLLAPMFGLNYDDLRQRHKEQRTKKILTWGAIAMAIVLSFGIFSTVTAIKIKKQSDMIESQNKEIVKQNEEISAQNTEIKEKSAQLAYKLEVSTAQESEELLRRGLRDEAIDTVYSVMPQTMDDEDIPYSTQAQYALTQALGVYVVGANFFPTETYENSSNITDMILSSDGKLLAYLDEDMKLSVINAESGENIANFENLGYGIDQVAFVGSKYIAAYDEKGEFLYDFETKDKTYIDEVADTIYVASDDSAFVAQGIDVVKVYDALTLKENFSFDIELDEDDILGAGSIEAIDFDTENGNVAMVIRHGSFLDKKPRRLYVYNVSSGECMADKVMDFGDYCTSVCLDGNMVYYCQFDDTDLNKTYGYVSAYDYVSDNKLYTTRIGNNSIKGISVTQKDGQKYLYGYDPYGPYTFDINDGTILYRRESSTRIIKSFELNDQNNRLLISERGDLLRYVVSQGLAVDYSIYACDPDVYVEDCCFIKGCVFLKPADYKYVIKYVSYMDPESEAYEGEDYIKLYDIETDIDEIFVEDKDMYVSLIDHEVYLLNKDKEKIARLKDCVGYDEKNKLLIFDINTQKAAHKICTYEEIIKKAKQYDK